MCVGGRHLAIVEKLAPLCWANGGRGVFEVIFSMFLVGKLLFWDFCIDYHALCSAQYGLKCWSHILLLIYCRRAATTAEDGGWGRAPTHLGFLRLGTSGGFQRGQWVIALFWGHVQGPFWAPKISARIGPIMAPNWPFFARKRGISHFLGSWLISYLSGYIGPWNSPEAPARGPFGSSRGPF